MRITKLMSGVLVALLVLSASATGGARQRRKMSRLPKQTTLAAGVWGGEHVRMEVTGQGAQLEYDCARGFITQRIVLDANGRFEAEGVYVRERGGPVRKGAADGGEPALYSGTVRGQSMTLDVKLVNKNETRGTFTLARGSEGQVRKCR